MVGLETLEGTFEFQAGAVFVASLGFAGEEIFSAGDILHPDSHTDFADTVFAIGGCDVEMGYTLVEGTVEDSRTAARARNSETKLW